MALRLPKQLKPKPGEVKIEVHGDAWIVLPAKAEKWPPGFFEKIRITDPGFSRPKQGRQRKVDF